MFEYRLGEQSTTLTLGHCNKINSVISPKFIKTELFQFLVLNLSEKSSKKKNPEPA